MLVLSAVFAFVLTPSSLKPIKVISDDEIVFYSDLCSNFGFYSRIINALTYAFFLPFLCR